MSDNPFREKLAELKVLADKANMDISRELNALEAEAPAPGAPACFQTTPGSAWSLPVILRGRQPSSTRKRYSMISWSCTETARSEMTLPWWAASGS